MKFVVFSALSVLVSVVNAFHVVPPTSITACEPFTCYYDTTSGEAPFNMGFHRDTADGPLIALFTDIGGASLTWPRVTIAAGTSVVMVLSDARGVGSAAPPVVISPGVTDDCFNTTSTTIPVVPSVTSTTPPTSTFNESLPITSSISSSSTDPGLASSLSSLSSVIESANSLASSLASSPPPIATALGSSGMVNAAGLYTICAITAFVGAFLA